jgi:hypothetical protein
MINFMFEVWIFTKEVILVEYAWFIFLQA